MNWKAFDVILIVIGIVAGLYVFFQFPEARQEDWYLGCVDVDGKEYLVKVKQKPRINGGFIEIGEDTYLTPRPMMTCRAVPASELDIAGIQKA